MLMEIGVNKTRVKQRAGVDRLQIDVLAGIKDPWREWRRVDCKMMAELPIRISRLSEYKALPQYLFGMNIAWILHGYTVPG